jgi:hypothetical protein
MGSGDSKFFDGEMRLDICAGVEGVFVQSDVSGNPLVARTPFAGDGGGIGNLDGQDVGSDEDEKTGELRDLQSLLALRARAAIDAGVELEARLPVAERMAESGGAARVGRERFRLACQRLTYLLSALYRNSSDPHIECQSS